ncbi:MAG: response regulator [Oscillospiraceae bacterium]|nr:response regulator [Oscillospiraceae bacterium]
MNSTNSKKQVKKPKILAVDDVSVVLNAITSALEAHYEVFCLTKAEQVERFLKNTDNVPDLFILDIEMPDMNGFDLIKEIREFEEHKETPIIILTGNATVRNFHVAFKQGVMDFIAKPVDSKVLLEKVNAQIKRK